MMSVFFCRVRARPEFTGDWLCRFNPKLRGRALGELDDLIAGTRAFVRKIAEKLP